MDDSGRKVLIADDEPDIIEILKYNLEKEGYAVITAKNGDEAIDKARLTHPDLIVLDMMMPRKSGMEVCEILRMQPSFKDTLIMFLTALSDEATQIKSFSAGADDYVVKPFRIEEVVARIRAIVRRSGGFASSRVEVEDLVLDTRAMQVTRDGIPISLSPQEYRLFAYLAHQRGRVVSQMEITEHLYAQDFERESNSIEVLVGRVRRRLGTEVIKTRRGFGYYMGTLEE